MGSESLNLWCLTVLCLLREGPLHPYEMQRLIRQRHSEDFLELKRGSLYHAIERLKRRGLIEEESTSREGRRPERTVYRITEKGEAELLDWLRQLLSKPARETSTLVAALSFAGHLSPQDVIDQLEIRANDLDCSIVAMTAVMQNLTPKIGRLPLLEAEYVGAMRKAELEWIRGLIEELRSGVFTWNTQQLLKWVREASQTKLDVKSGES